MKVLSVLVGILCISGTRFTMRFRELCIVRRLFCLLVCVFLCFPFMSFFFSLFLICCWFVLFFVFCFVAFCCCKPYIGITTFYNKAVNTASTVDDEVCGDRYSLGTSTHSYNRGNNGSKGTTARTIITVSTTFWLDDYGSLELLEFTNYLSDNSFMYKLYMVDMYCRSL